ncbi:MAG: hypothetical protein DI589_17230 [Shinella sp.]|nr:MAG: hypothetical protein DI589_17230 [Shinella sp.]
MKTLSFGKPAFAIGQPMAPRGVVSVLSGQGGGAPYGYSYLIDKTGVVMLDARGNKLLMKAR